MPNLVTHYLLVRRIYSEMAREGNFLFGHFPELALGTQGPDILFYTYWSPTRFHPIIGKRQIGDQLHKENGAKLFSSMLKELENIKDPDEADSFKSYILGCLAHLILDRETHPLTYWLTGYGKGHLVRHSRLESAYATWMCQNDPDSKDLIHNPLAALPNDELSIARLDLHFNNTLESIFGMKLPKHPIREGVKTYRLMMEFVCSHLGTDILPVSIAKALKMPDHVGDDCVNLDHKEWRVPATGEVRTESFLDLYDRALNLVRSAAESFLTQGFRFDVVSKYLNNYCYEGYELGCEMKYFSSDILREKW